MANRTPEEIEIELYKNALAWIAQLGSIDATPEAAQHRLEALTKFADACVRGDWVEATQVRAQLEARLDEAEQ